MEPSALMSFNSSGLTWINGKVHLIVLMLTGRGLLRVMNCVQVIDLFCTPCVVRSIVLLLVKSIVCNLRLFQVFFSAQLVRLGDREEQTLDVVGFSNVVWQHQRECDTSSSWSPIFCWVERFWKVIVVGFQWYFERLSGVVYSITRCCNSTSIQSQLCVYLQALTFIMQRINRVVVSRSVVMIELQICVRRTQSHKVE